MRNQVGVCAGRETQRQGGDHAGRNSGHYGSPRSSIELNGEQTPDFRTLTLHESSAAKNPLAEPVRDDFVETVKTSSEPEVAHRRASERLRNPPILHPVGLYCGMGRCRGWKRHPSNEGSLRSSLPMS